MRIKSPSTGVAQIIDVKRSMMITSVYYTIGVEEHFLAVSVDISDNISEASFRLINYLKVPAGKTVAQGFDTTGQAQLIVPKKGVFTVNDIQVFLSFFQNIDFNTIFSKSVGEYSIVSKLGFASLTDSTTMNTTIKIVDQTPDVSGRPNVPIPLNQAVPFAKHFVIKGLVNTLNLTSPSNTATLNFNPVTLTQLQSVKTILPVFVLGPVLVNLQEKTVTDTASKSTPIVGNILASSRVISISKQTSYGESCALLQGQTLTII